MILACLTHAVERRAQCPGAHAEVALHRPDRSGLLLERSDALVVAVGHDKVINTSTSLVYAATLPGAQNAQIHAAGHFAPVEQPDAVAQAMRDWVKA